MMNTERAAMRGKLAEARDREGALRLRIEGNCRMIREGLNTAMTPIHELEIPLVAAQMDELVMAWGELQAVLSDIARLTRELY